jgi:hypothetical protein
MYDCEAENQFKVAKAFFIIDGKIIFPESREKKFFNLYLDSILSNTTMRKQQRTSSPSYGK